MEHVASCDVLAAMDYWTLLMIRSLDAHSQWQLNSHNVLIQREDDHPHHQ